MGIGAMSDVGRMGNFSFSYFTAQVLNRKMTSSQSYWWAFGYKLWRWTALSIFMGVVVDLSHVELALGIMQMQ